MRRYVQHFLFFFALLILVPAGRAFAQADTNGGVNGRIADDAGRPVGGAALTLTNLDTNLTRSATSTQDGRYAFPRVVPGRYKLTAERDGFQRLTREGIVVAVNETAVVNLALTVGATTETVMIQAGADLTQSQSVEVSQLVNERRVRELPLNGENFQRLIRLAPGIGGNLAGTANNPSINGARTFANTYTVDGIGANDERQVQGLSLNGGGAGFGDGAPNLVSTEAIQEFRVITSNADASFGRGSGGQINIVTRGGTNAYRGSVYHYLRNDIFDARDFFNLGPFFDSRGRAVPPPFRQNLYGASFGGPIVRDKHFFFGNFEGFRQRLQQTGAPVVPNAALIGLIPGDLGRLFRTYYIDRNVVPAQGNPNGVFTPLAATDALRQQFVAAGFNPALFDGNQANGEAGTVALRTALTRNIDQDTFLVRTDHQFSERLTASFRYNFAQPRQLANFSGVPNDDRETNQRWQNFQAQTTLVLSPTQLVEGRVGVLRSRSSGQPRGGFDDRLTALGISPRLGIIVGSVGTGLNQLSVPGTAGFNDFQTIPQFSATHTWTRGALTLRTGFDARRVIVNLIQESSATPSYTFNGFLGATGLLGANASQGQATAASVFASLFGQNGPFTTNRGWRSSQQEYFAQADWRVRRDLTVNLGLRYSYFGVYSEVNGAVSNLYAVDPATGNIRDDVSPFRFGRTANVVATATGGRSFYQPDRNNFQPRIGIAWTIGGKTVVRAGYGMYNDRLYQLQFTSVAFNPPFAVSSSVSNLPFRLGGTIPVNAGLPSLSVVDPTIRNPYTHQVNVTVEHQLGRDTTVSAGFVGSYGRKLFRWSEPNAFGAVPQAARPDPRFTDQRLITNDSRSNYSSLQVTGKRRFAAGLDFTAAYTFSRFEDDVSVELGFPRAPSLLNLGASSAPGFQGGGNQFAPRPFDADFGLSDYDVRHNFTVSHLYELPLGRGRRFLNQAPGWVNALIGDWALAGILIARSGEPINITRGIDFNEDGDAASDRPALVGGRLSDLYARGNPLRTQFLVSQADALRILNTPTNVTDPFASIERNALRSPNVMFYDASVIKKFTVSERVRVSFEANAFNLFNRVNFAAPVTSLASPLFGRVTSTRRGTNPRQLQFGLKISF